MDETSALTRKAAYGFAILAILSAGIFVVGAAEEPQRIWANLLVGSYGLLGFGLGGAVLLALVFVTGAHWSDLVRPVAENLTRLVPLGAIGVAIVLIACPSLYPWTTAAPETASQFQALWLNRPFFLARAFVYLALWTGMAFVLVRASRHQSTRAHGDLNRSNAIRVSAIFLVIYALTCWLASVDWVMSLEPHWTSTVFGIYHFSGMFLSALAAFIVAAILFDRRGFLRGRLKPGQLHDLGTLLFSFSSFWMYIWFSQYMLIWYVNNPEETGYYVLRQGEQWQPLFLANLMLNWGIPFLVLLFRRAKESPGVLFTVAAIVLLGRWVDLYVMVLPPVTGVEGARLFDACLLPGMLALAALVVVKHPSLEPSPLGR